MRHIPFARFGAGLLMSGASFGAFAQSATQVQIYGLVGAYAGKMERSGGPESNQ